MTICARNPFDCRGGSHLLVGGYSYWPLWFYGQRNELPDVSGHGVTLYPSGAYFDGQGYYFDGSDDYLADAGGRRVLDKKTRGSWHSVYLTEGTVPAKGSIWGTGDVLWLNFYGAAPKIKGKIVFKPEYCPNLTHLFCNNNNISVLDISGFTGFQIISCHNNNLSAFDTNGLVSLTELWINDNNLSALDTSSLTSIRVISCAGNNLSALDVSSLTTLDRIYCGNNNISVLDISALTSLYRVWCYSNSISLLDVSALVSLTYLLCQNNSMNQDMVDTVLCDLDSHGTSSGTLNISGNAAPSATGVACKDNLVSRGWSVTTD